MKDLAPGDKVRLKRTITYGINGPAKQGTLTAGLEGVVHQLGVKREIPSSDRWVVWVIFPGRTMAIFTTDIEPIA